MAHTTHFLYLSAAGLVCLNDDGRGLVQGPSFEANFELNDQGHSTHQALSQWLIEYRRDTFVLIVDVSEEEFAIEQVPILGRNDQLAVIRRRLSQKFREARLQQWAVLKQSTGKFFSRKKDSERQVRVLMSAVARDSVIYAWLHTLEHSRVAVRSVVSPALLAHRLMLKQLKSTSAMIVSWSPAGLRQTVIFKGEVRFTRLAAQLPSVGLAAVQTECLRTIQYLLMSQQVSRDDLRSIGLPIWILEGGITGLDHAPERLAVDTSVEVPLGVIPAIASLTQASTALGSLASWCAIESFPLVPGSHRRGYASEALLRGYRVRLVERWFFRSGATALGCALIGLVASLCLKALWPADSQALLLKTQKALATKNQLKAELAQFTVPGSEMQSVVEIANGLRKRHVDAYALMQMLSAAVDAEQNIDLHMLRWRRLEPAQRMQWVSFDFTGKGEQSSDGTPSKGGSNPLPQALSSGGTTPLGSAALGSAALGSAALGSAALGSAVLGSGTFGSAPLGATSSMPTLGAPGLAGMAGQQGLASLGPVVLELKGSLNGQPLMQEANKQAKQFAQRIRDFCHCEVIVSTLPFDPEASLGFSKSFEARSESDKHLASFTIRALFSETPDISQVVQRPKSAPTEKPGGQG
jgi:hypothetical protein